ncbi:alpha-1,2-mannosyltransferase [Streptacidiphilus sp. MAP12-16]|uniref:glycosyltransferase 87 family protein n=1 Tax=Streptacidiphilus sp. MAP12-16 TaxID=3156300 RepID=UPI003515AF1D
MTSDTTAAARQSAGRHRRKPRPDAVRIRRRTAAALAFALLSLIGYLLGRNVFGTHGMIDALVYQAEGAAVVSGHSLYDLTATSQNLAATYPPFAALVFVPSSRLSASLLAIAVTAGNAALLGVVAWLSCKLADWPARRWRLAAAGTVAGLALWTEPVSTTFRYGQINLLVAALVLWDLTRGDDSRLTGLGSGIAAGIKLTPGIFALHLLLTGRVRVGLAAGTTFLGTVALGWLLLPRDSLRYWTQALFDTTRVGATQDIANQSLDGLLARSLHTATPGLIGTGLGLAVGAAGLTVAGYVWRSYPSLARARAWSGVCVAVTALLVSPISWSHHWVWCVPMLVLLAAETMDRLRYQRPDRWTWTLGGALLLGAAVFLSHAFRLLPITNTQALHLTWYQQLLAGAYPLYGLLFLGLAPAWARSRRRHWARELRPQTVARSRERELATVGSC